MVESRIADDHGSEPHSGPRGNSQAGTRRPSDKAAHGGYTVTGLTREDIEESFGIRAVLEGYAARLATVKHAPEHLKPLFRKNDLFRKASANR